MHRNPPARNPGAPSAQSPTITLELADAPRVHLPGGATQPLGAIDAQLLAWLALHGPTRRDRLAALLWPDSPSDSARNSLRQRLFRLRRQCGVELVQGTLQLDLADNVAHDLDGSATLLASLSAELGSELGDWLDSERRRRREHARADLAGRIDALERAGELAAAMPLAEALVGLDPLREDAHRCLMRLLYLAGDRAAALGAFDRCEQQLKHELGTRPSPETLALLTTIEAAVPQATAPPGARRSLPAALMRPPRMVGRQAELDRLRQVLGSGRRALVLGSAGLGKTRLLQAVAEVSPHPLWAGARPGDALVPYATLGRALRALQQQLPFELDEQRAAQLAPLLPEHADVSRGRAGSPASSPVRHDTLVAALASVLGTAITTLGGIVLDDLHFADVATLQMLPDLATACTGGAWLLSSRPPAGESPTAQLLSDLAALGGWETLTLAPLDNRALADLVDSLALPDVHGEQLAPMLNARSGGNPLFALETLRLAWTEGHAIESGALPSPRNLGHLIDTVLGAMSPQALLLARVAAIAGVDFSVELAEQVLRQGALELADPWAELEARQVLRGTAFSHDLMHEAVLSGIPEVLARHAHGQVAAWLEQRRGEPARVAAHWEAAGQRERALPALRAAAERAHAALREPERVAFLLRGVDIAEAADNPNEAFELLSQAIEAHMNVLRDADGLPLLDRLDRLARTPHQAARSADRRAWYHTTQGNGSLAIATGRLALGRSCEVNDPQLQAQASQRLGTALAMVGQFDEALPLLRAAEPWVQANAASEEAAEFEGNLAAVLDNLGRPADAEPHHHRAIELTRARGNHSFQATARANLAVNRLDAGDVAEAREQLTLAQQLLSSFDVRGGSRGFIAALQAQAERASGHYVEALRWCDEAETLIALASPLRLPVVLMHRAQTLLDLGQAARAQQNLARCDLAALPARQLARHGLLTGRLRLALQQDARASFDAALAAAPDPGWPELRLTLRIERAEVLAPDAAVIELQSVVDAAQASRLAGVALAGQLRLARRAHASAPGSTADTAQARAIGTAMALAAAEAALATPPAIEPNGLYRGERWLGPASALLAGGQPERGRALACEGWAWVQACAATLPAPWRDAFLHRQPVNQALQALVGRQA